MNSNCTDDAVQVAQTATPNQSSLKVRNFPLISSHKSAKNFLKCSGLCRGFSNFIDVTVVMVSFKSVAMAPHPSFRSPVSVITFIEQS